MAVEVRPTPAEEAEVPSRPYYDPASSPEFPPPDLGRTVHVVDRVINVDPEETPHPRVRRGELGKALFNYSRNTTSQDPIGRISSNRARDARNFMTTLLRQSKGGKTNPEKTGVPDPAVMT